MLLLRLLFVLLASATLAGSAIADDLAPMKASCLKTCSEPEGDKMFCETYCACTTTEMGKYRGLEREKALRSDAKIQAIAGLCLGRHFSSFFVGSGCLDECAGDASCKKKCTCMKEKIRGLGGDNEAAEFLTRFAKDDPAANKQMNEWMATCEAG